MKHPKLNRTQQIPQKNKIIDYFGYIVIVIMNDTAPISHVVDYTESIQNSAEPHTKGADTMKSITKFVGLDVSKEKIAVAVADEGRVFLVFQCC